MAEGSADGEMARPDDPDKYSGDDTVVDGFEGGGKAEERLGSVKIEVPPLANRAGCLPWDEDLEMLSFFSDKKVFCIYISLPCDG